MIWDPSQSGQQLMDEFLKLYSAREVASLMREPAITQEDGEPYFFITYKDVEGKLFINRTSWAYDAAADTVFHKQTYIRLVNN